MAAVDTAADSKDTILSMNVMRDGEALKPAEESENKKIKYIVSAGIVLLLLVLCAVLFARGDRVVSVIKYVGTAGVERANIEDSLKIFDGMRLEAGDLVWTKESSNVMMLIDEDKAVRLEENSEAEFREIQQGKGGQLTSIDLKKGTLINDLREKLNDNIIYEITTPNATVSVRGTYFVVYVGEAQGYNGIVTKVNVYDGVVALENKNGQITILHSGEQGTAQWETWESGLNIPSGNRAIVGEEAVYTFKGVDFEGLNASDLDRLEEIVEKGETALTLKEIEARRMELKQQETEQETAADEGKAEQISHEGKDDSDGDGIDNTAGQNDTVQHTERSGPMEKPSNTRADSKIPKPEIQEVSGKPGTAEEPSHVTDEMSSADLEYPENAAEPHKPSGGSSSAEKPSAEVTSEQESSSDSSGGTSEEETTSSEESSTQEPSTAVPDFPDFDEILNGEKEKYAPVHIMITNENELKEKIDAMAARKELLKTMASTPVSQGYIIDAETWLNAAQAKLDKTRLKVSHVNTVLDMIIALPYPCQIQDSDNIALQSARAAFGGLSPDEQSLVPQKMFDKLSACENALLNN